MNIPEEAVAMMLRVANREGLNGNQVRIYWVPPDSGTQDFRGNMVIEYREEQSGSENDW